MLVIIIGLIVGTLAALGPLGFLASPAQHLSNALVSMGTHIATTLTHSATPKTQSIVTALAAALMPAIVAAGLLLAARCSHAARRIVAVVAVVVAITGLIVLPGSQAAVVVVTCLVVIVVSFFVSTAASLFFAFCGAYQATATIHSLWQTSPTTKLHTAALTLSHYVTISASSIQLILSALIGLICLTAVVSTLRGTTPTPPTPSSQT